MKAVAEVLGVARSNLHDRLSGRTKPRRRYHKAQDGEWRTPCVQVSRERSAVDREAGGGAADLRLPAGHGAAEPVAARAGAGAGEPQAHLPDHAGQQPASRAEPYRATGAHPRRQGRRHALEPAVVQRRVRVHVLERRRHPRRIPHRRPRSGDHCLAGRGERRHQWIGRARHDARGGREAVRGTPSPASGGDAQRQRAVCGRSWKDGMERESRLWPFLGAGTDYAALLLAT